MLGSEPNKAPASWFVTFIQPRLLPLLLALLTTLGSLAWAVFYFYPNAGRLLPDDPVAAATFGSDAFAVYQAEHKDLDSTPSLIVVGGSSMVEALAWPDNISKELSSALGRNIPVVNLSTGGQTLLGSFHILLSTPIHKGSIVAIHVNIGRLQGSLSEISRYLESSSVLFFDWGPLAALDPEAPRSPSLYAQIRSFSAWVPMMMRHQIIARVEPDAVDAIRQVVRTRTCDSWCRDVLSEDWLRDPTPETVGYEYDRTPLPVPERQRIIDLISARQMILFKNYYADAINILAQINEYVEEQGAKLVLVNLPQSPLYKDRVSSVADMYQTALGEVAAEGVVVLDYSDRLSLEVDDFYDYTHMLAKARGRLAPLFLADMVDLFHSNDPSKQ